MWLTLLMGLGAAFNPFMLATTLSFVGILTYFRHTRAQLISDGLIFLIVVWLVNFFVLSGGYDQLIYKPFVPSFITLFYSTLALFFCYTGYLHFRDWAKFQKIKDMEMFQLGLPRFLDVKPQRKGLLRVFIFMIVAAIFAWVLTLAESRLSQNYYLFVLMQRAVTEEGAPVKALFLFCWYMFGYSIVLIVFFAFFIVESFSIRVRKKMNQMVSLEKISYAAMYFAVAAGLIFYLTEVIQF